MEVRIPRYAIAAASLVGGGVRRLPPLVAVLVLAGCGQGGNGTDGVPGESSPTAAPTPFEATDTDTGPQGGGTGSLGETGELDIELVDGESGGTGGVDEPLADASGATEDDDDPVAPTFVPTEDVDRLTGDRWRLVRVELDDGSTLELPDGELDPGYRLGFAPTFDPASGTVSEGAGTVSGTHLCNAFEGVYRRGDATLLIERAFLEERDCPTRDAALAPVERALFGGQTLSLELDVARLELVAGTNERLVYVGVDRNVPQGNLADFQRYVPDGATVVDVVARYRDGEPWTRIKAVPDEGGPAIGVVVDPDGRVVDAADVPPYRRRLLEDGLAERLRRSLDADRIFDVTLLLAVEIRPIDPGLPSLEVSSSAGGRGDPVVIEYFVDGVEVDEGTYLAVEERYEAERLRAEREREAATDRAFDALIADVGVPSERVLGTAYGSGSRRFLLTRAEIEGLVRDPPEGLRDISAYAETTIDTDGG